MTGRVLGVVPARGGSRGIPGKNVRPLAGKPLLAYVAGAASGVVDRLVLTTDSEKVATIGREVGLEVPFLRPADLAQDDSPMQATVEHAVRELETEGWYADVVLVLQPTAPLRRREHIEQALRIMADTPCTSVVSVVQIPAHYSPHYAMKIVDNRLENYVSEGRGLSRRQDAPVAYSRDGTIYAVRRDVLMKQHDLYGDDCRPLVLPDEESVNLDTERDWESAERMIRG